jgi:hypothetical protein
MKPGWQLLLELLQVDSRAQVDIPSEKVFRHRKKQGNLRPHRPRGVKPDDDSSTIPFRQIPFRRLLSYNPVKTTSWV